MPDRLARSGSKFYSLPTKSVGAGLRLFGRRLAQALGRAGLFDGQPADPIANQLQPFLIDH